MSDITVHPVRETDIPFIREQHVHVEATAAPPWRRVESSIHGDAWIENVTGNAPDDQAIFDAVDVTGERLGYTWVLALTDFDAVEPHGHVAEVGVAAQAQGRGVGSQLIAAAENWCRKQDLLEVTLHCYIGNERAHRLYQHLGFENEWYQMRKGL